MGTEETDNSDLIAQNCWLVREQEVKDEDDSTLSDNCWLVKDPEDQNVDNKEQSEKDCLLAVNTEDKEIGASTLVENCWLVTEQDDEEVESSLLAEDVWIAATSEHGDVTLTDTDCWLPKVEVKDETISSVEDSVDPSPNGSLMRGWKDIPEEEVTVPEEEAKEDDEASIVTLDPTEEYDDFSDMQLELSQWISSV